MAQRLKVPVVRHAGELVRRGGTGAGGYPWMGGRKEDEGAIV